MLHPTVLVVDDERLIRWSLAERLKQENYRVVEADTAASALERHAEGVDLVFEIVQRLVRRPGEIRETCGKVRSEPARR